jgi:hypothetical protein
LQAKDFFRIMSWVNLVLAGIYVLITPDDKYSMWWVTYTLLTAVASRVFYEYYDRLFGDFL